MVAKKEGSIREALNKSHRGRCRKNGPRARRLRGRIPAVGCNHEANTAPGLLSPQPGGLKPFVDFCGVASSGETAAGIAQRSRLQKSATGLQRPSWDFISVSLDEPPFVEINESGTSHILRLEESLKLTKAGGVAHFAERFGLDLTDTLAGHLELLTHLLERS